jgi:hypothetical protein
MVQQVVVDMIRRRCWQGGIVSDWLTFGHRCGAVLGSVLAAPFAGCVFPVMPSQHVMDAALAMDSGVAAVVFWLLT